MTPREEFEQIMKRREQIATKVAELQAEDSALNARMHALHPVVAEEDQEKADQDRISVHGA